ncbi:MAG: hypothetical protein QM688_01900, partial [Sphingomonas bacterium]
QGSALADPGLLFEACHQSSKASPMDHPLDLNDEASAALDAPDTLNTIRAITARLRDREETVGRATHDGGPDDFHSPAPDFHLKSRFWCRNG